MSELVALAERLEKLMPDLHPRPWAGDDEEPARINDAEGCFVAQFGGVAYEWLSASSLLCDVANNLPLIIEALRARAAAGGGR